MASTNATSGRDSHSPFHPLAGQLRIVDYLRRIGVPDLHPHTATRDNGDDPFSVEGHLDQSGHLMERLKLSSSYWLIADEDVTRRKVAAASAHSVPTVIGRESFEIAVVKGELETYIDLCAEMGVTRIECGEGATDTPVAASLVVRLARERGLDVQFELGRNRGVITGETVQRFVDNGHRWLDAGALQLAVQTRENLKGASLFDKEGHFHGGHADRLARAFGLETVTFDAPDRPSQVALLDHFGRDVHLYNVRLSELLFVEVYRRGLAVESFSKHGLKLATSPSSLTHG